MGNVQAAGPGVVPPPPMPGAGGEAPPQVNKNADTHEPHVQPVEPSEDSGPGYFEDLHKKCKDVFPVPFEGAKVMVNKGLSNHFQISHSLTMSSMVPAGYRFGCTYVGTKQFSPVEAFPILMGDIDGSGNLNANIIHQFSKNTRCKFVSQIQNNRWVASQLTTDVRGSDYTASLTCGNPDLINGSGVYVGQYLQNITSRLAVGAELLYQYGPTVPGNQLAIYTLASRFTGKDWQISGNLTPMAGALHACYYQKITDNVHISAELEGSLRTQEVVTMIGYQIDLPSANVSFRGQLDSNYCAAAVMEKKLMPLPFTFALSAYLNHVKNSYRFGIGLIIG